MSSLTQIPLFFGDLTQIPFCFSWAHTDPTDLTDFFLLFFGSHRSHRSHGFARLALNLTEALRTALKKRPFSHKLSLKTV